MIIHPTDVHSDPDKARLGVGLAAEALGVECSFKLTSMWLIKIDPRDLKAFLEIAREAANVT